MGKFQVGDRIAVYWGKRDTGTVVGHNQDLIMISPDDLTLNFSTAHPKQCRKLVKKERRRFWLNYHCGGFYGYAYRTKKEADDSAKGTPAEECIEVVEVRNKK